MGGVVKLATGGKKETIADMTPEPQKETVSKAETQLAMQKQASARARRGMGGLFGRVLGGVDKLGG